MLCLSVFFSVQMGAQNYKNYISVFYISLKPVHDVQLSYVNSIHLQAPYWEPCWIADPFLNGGTAQGLGSTSCTHWWAEVPWQVLPGPMEAMQGTGTCPGTTSLKTMATRILEWQQFNLWLHCRTGVEVFPNMFHLATRWCCESKVVLFNNRRDATNCPEPAFEKTPG